MAQQDYCEIILNAVSQIVTAETAAKQNKGMIACRVKDITERNLGRYSVNYKGDTFLACGEATDYEIDDEVYVLRAENTGSQLSVIVGRKLREDEFPIQINDPLTKMMRLKEWRPTGASGVYEVTPSAPYDTIGLSFDAKGKFTITLKVVNMVGRTYTYKLDETNFLFSSDFGIALTQRCTIDISRTGTPLRVELSTTGDLTNFIVDFGYNITNKLESDKALKLYTEGEQKYYTDSFGNLKENNTVNLYLDWLYLDENAEIKSLTHINYLENKPLGFDVYWYKQTEGADGDFYSGPGWTKIIIEDTTQDPDYRVYYIEKDNLFALSGYYNALFAGDLEQTAIKAIITYTPIGATSVETIVSNELIFENIQDEPLEYITRGSIELSDGSNAVYPLWALNGFLKDQNDVYKEREFNFSYSTGLGVEALYKNIASVTWYIPKANMYYFSKERISSTAIQSLEGEYAVLTIIPFEIEVKKDEQGNNIPLGDDFYKEALKEIFRADYKLMERYIANRISNKVICEINFKDETETWKQERDLYFSKAGLDGTGSQILIWLTDKNGNLARNVQFGEGNTYTVNTLFVDENGESLPDLSPLSVTVQHGMSSEKGQGKYEDGIYTPPSNPLGYNVEYPTYCDILKVVYQIEPEKQESTQEIVYEWDGSVGAIVETKPEIITTVKPATTYTEYYPISYALQADYGYEGPTYITYDSSGGNPTYDNISLAIWEDNKRFEGRSDVVWWLQYQLAETQYIDAIPKLKPKVGGQTGAFLEAPSEKDKSVKLYPANYYENSIDYVVSIIIYEKKVMGTYTEYKPWYIQPLVIRQARHFSTILDNWDGQFKIDAENGYVLSSALVAGNKNEKNEFSGVIAGTLNTMMNLEVPVVSPYPLDNNGKPITDENGKNIEEDTIVYKTNRIYRENQTGILGYKDGIQTYGFLDDGTAFIGPSGQGQILFNGTEGKIKSGGNFIKARQDSKTGVITTEGTGMIIDFTYGGIYAPNFVLDPLGNASFAGRISADWGTIGGYNIASRMLYTKVNENKYMALLSPSYKAAKYEDNPANYGEDTAKERDNWYYWKKIDENSGQYEEYPGIPHIENQAGPGLIIENNNRRLRALFNKTNKQPQYMVDWYKVEEDKTETNLGSVVIGWEQATEIDSYYPGLFGEGALGDGYKLGVTGKEVAKIKFATGQQQEEAITGTFLYMKNMKPVYRENSSPPVVDKYVVGSETFVGNNKLLFSSDKQISSFGINSFWTGNVAFATTVPAAEKTDGGWTSALNELTPGSAGIHITQDQFTSIQVGQANKDVYAIWRIGTGANGLRAMRNEGTEVTGSFEVSLPLSKESGYLKWNPGNHFGEFVLKSDGKTKSELAFKGSTATICGLNIEEKIETTAATATYNILQSRKIDSSASEIIFGGDGTSSDNPYIDKEVVTSGRTIYIGTTNENNGTTDKIIFTVPVEFADSDNNDVDNIAPTFSNSEGAIFKDLKKKNKLQLLGSAITGGVWKEETSNGSTVTTEYTYYTLSSDNTGLKLYNPQDQNSTAKQSIVYLNNQGLSLNNGETPLFMLTYANTNRTQTKLWAKETVITLQDKNTKDCLQIDTISEKPSITSNIPVHFGNGTTKSTITADGTDASLTVEELYIKRPGSTYIRHKFAAIGGEGSDYTGIQLNTNFKATTLYEGKNKLEDIYLKKNSLILDDTNDDYLTHIQFNPYEYDGNKEHDGYRNYYTVQTTAATDTSLEYITYGGDSTKYYTEGQAVIQEEISGTEETISVTVNWTDWDYWTENKTFTAAEAGEQFTYEVYHSYSTPQSKTETKKITPKATASYKIGEQSIAISPTLSIIDS